MAFHNSKRAKETFPVKVVTMDADLELEIEKKAVGRELFDLVCRTIGLREVWYFGLQFRSTSGCVRWVEASGPLLRQGVDGGGETVFHFLVKFFPENVEDELIQDTTRHLFFLQVLQAIRSEAVACPAEAGVLLASFAVQAQLGDEEAAEDQALDPATLLPPSVLNEFQMTSEMWEERIRRWWAQNKGLDREEAEMEYLKIAQGLDQVGVHFFPVEVGSGTEWLGVAPTAVLVFPDQARTSPSQRFQWKDILNISVKGTKLCVKVGVHFFPVEVGSGTEWLGVAPTAVLVFSDHGRTSPSQRFQWKDILNISVKGTKLCVKIVVSGMVSVEGGEKSWCWKGRLGSGEMAAVVLELCVGSHNLYLDRRRADSVEIQQMKAQAKEARERSLAASRALEAERRGREAAEAESERRRQRIEELEATLEAQTDLLNRTESMAELLAEKAKVSAEEVTALSRRAAAAKAAAGRLSESLSLAAKRPGELRGDFRSGNGDFRSQATDFRPGQGVNDFRPELRTMGEAAQRLRSASPPLAQPPPSQPGPDGSPRSSIRALSAQMERERADYDARVRRLGHQLNHLHQEISTVRQAEGLS